MKKWIRNDATNHSRISLMGSNSFFLSRLRSIQNANEKKRISRKLQHISSGKNSNDKKDKSTYDCWDTALMESMSSSRWANGTSGTLQFISSPIPVPITIKAPPVTRNRNKIILEMEVGESIDGLDRSVDYRHFQYLLTILKANTLVSTHSSDELIVARQLTPIINHPCSN